MCVFSVYLQFILYYTLLCPQGVRKDRGRVLRRDKRWTGTRDKSTKELEHRTVPPQDGRKRSSSSNSAGGGKSSIAGMPPDQVLIHVEKMNIYSKFYGNAAICFVGQGKFDLKVALDKRSKDLKY